MRFEQNKILAFKITNYPLKLFITKKKNPITNPWREEGTSKVKH